MKRIRIMLAIALSVAIMVAFAPTTGIAVDASAASRPGVPANLDAKAIATGTVGLEWDKVDGAKGYYVYQKAPEKSGFTKIKTLKKAGDTDCVLSNLKKEKTYSYKVIAYKGKKTGRFSATVKVKTRDLKKEIKALDGVSSVETINMKGVKNRFREKYIVTFEQPLDWANPAKGSFSQRMEVGIDDAYGINTALNNGYMINEENFNKAVRNELTTMTGALNGWGANNINIEHRFFGKSVPEGLSNDSTEYWEYLTTKNAADDENKIICELGKVLSGKWIAAGRSKGGLTANMFTMYHPESVDLTVSYVAPLCDPDDSRLYDFVYNAANSENYGKAERKLMTEFQIYCLKNRDILLPMYKEACDKEKYVFREGVSYEDLFDVCVLEGAVYIWQYYQDFTDIEKVMKMPEDSLEDNKAKAAAAMDVLRDYLAEANTNGEPFPYFVQTAKELGNNFYDFSFLRKAIREAGYDDEQLLHVDKNHRYSAADMLFTDEQKAAFTYDPTMNRNLKKWVKTTDKTVIMIYGSSDPWYSVRIPDADEINPNIHIFVSHRNPHTSEIDDTIKITGEKAFGAPTIRKIKNIISETLDIEVQ